MAAVAAVLAPEALAGVRLSRRVPRAVGSSWLIDLLRDVLPEGWGNDFTNNEFEALHNPSFSPTALIMFVGLLARADKVDPVTQGSICARPSHAGTALASAPVSALDCRVEQ